MNPVIQKVPTVCGYTPASLSTKELDCLIGKVGVYTPSSVTKESLGQWIGNFYSSVVLEPTPQLPPVGIYKSRPAVSIIARSPPVGIENRRNSCYANSIFQMLASTPTLWQALSRNANPGLKKLLEGYEGSVQTGSVCDFNSDLDRLIFPGAVGRQQDAEEAFRHLFPEAFKVTMRSKSLVMTQYEYEASSPTIVEMKAFVENSSRAEQCSRVLKEYDVDRVDLETRDLLRKCNDGYLGTFFEQEQSRKDVPILGCAVRSEETQSFVQCMIERFTRTNWPRKENLQMTVIDNTGCFKSNESSFFEEPPGFLLFNINRIQSGGEHVFRGLLTLDDVVVRFPGTCFSSKEDVPYRLTGFCCHSGNGATSGHYQSFVTRLGAGNALRYYSVNDKKSREISRHEFLDHFASCSIASFEKVAQPRNVRFKEETIQGENFRKEPRRSNCLYPISSFRPLRVASLQDSNAVNPPGRLRTVPLPESSRVASLIRRMQAAFSRISHAMFFRSR